MEFFEHDCYPAHPAALVMLAVVVPVRAYWQDWVFVLGFGVEPVVEPRAEHFDVGPEVYSMLREAAAGSCWTVALVLHRTDPAAENVASLEPEVELLDLLGRRLDQLLDVEGHPAVVPEIDRMTDRDAVRSTVGEPVGFAAKPFGMEGDVSRPFREDVDLERSSVAEGSCLAGISSQHANERWRAQD